MNNAFDVVFRIDDGEVRETRFVEFVENQGAKDFFSIDEDHFGFFNHELADRASVKTHDSSDAIAIFGSKN